ncbi:hypothetical protein HBA54_09125 [Pelagibius litoralis]|uniref:Uncharacterized protein n=1 Tax=Pelagibius litoralis TaxID=374515 RepID=A0A967EVJ4_9PROT|nr:hypothetical protein [Pelagibius litoralis]NIA68751.1 hypothetical protein [Pelagibius litoralis]
MRLPLFVLLTTALGIAGAHASAFEVLGFAQGMSLAEARSMALRNGYRIEKESSDAQGVYIVAGHHLEDFRIQFCEDELHWVTYRAGSGFVDFVKAVESAKASSNYKELSSDLAYRIDDNGKDEALLTVSLAPKEGDYFLSYSLRGTSEEGTPDFMVTYRAIRLMLSVLRGGC